MTARELFEAWYDAQPNGRLDPWDVWQAALATTSTEPVSEQPVVTYKPIAKIHSDGYWTAIKGFKEPLNFSSIEVYAATPSAPA